MSTHVVWVDVEASQSMCHFLPFVERHNLHVVPFIAVLHESEERFWVVEGVSQLWHQLRVVIRRELQELTRLNLQGLKDQLDFFYLVYYCLGGVCGAWRLSSSGRFLYKLCALTDSWSLNRFVLRRLTIFLCFN